MPDSDHIIGEIHNPRGETCVEWKIENYFSIPQKVNSSVTSPNFYFSNACWFLRIYPNGQRENKSVDWLSFYLGRRNSITECLSVAFSLGIRYEDGRIFAKVSNSVDFFSNRPIGYPKFIPRFELQRNMHEIAPGGTLRVFCIAKNPFSITTAASQTLFLDGIKTLSQSFESLLHNGRKSDVTIKVKSRSFRVHKLILGTRSSVFSAMFEHDMKESSSGVVHIADCEPDIFHDFLSFVYTGKIENLSSYNVTGLYSLADKYDISDLKTICMDNMKDNLCLDTVCEVVAIADRHKEVELKKSAVELIGKNIKAVISTEKWISFMAKNSVLAAELLMTVLPDKY